MSTETEKDRLVRRAKELMEAVQKDIKVLQQIVSQPHQPKQPKQPKPAKPT